LPAGEVAIQVERLLHLHREEHVRVIRRLPRIEVGVARIAAVGAHPSADPEGVEVFGEFFLNVVGVGVDDSLLVREMQQRILFSSGYRVETASGGRAALERLSLKRYHVVVAGARMAGGMDGIQLLAEARKSDYTRELPFILVASAEHGEDLVRARAAGAKGCVTREEFTPDRMTALIGGILGRGAGG